MARRQKTDELNGETKSAGLDDIGFDVFGSELAIEKFGITDFLSTGSYNLNRIAGGGLFKGIPTRRITTIAGEEATGKTLFALCIAREAIKKGYLIVYFDSENALTQEFAKNVGVDTTKILYKQVATIEELRNGITDITKWKAEKYSEDHHMLIIVDSFGGLTINKFINDWGEGKDNVDMGLFAKISKASLKLITTYIIPHNLTIVCTNHLTTDTSGYVPQKTMTGGRGIFYYSSLIIYLRKAKVKDGDDITGINITSQNVKSRVTPPFQTAEIYLDWKHGLSPESGLFDIMLKLGIVRENGKGWYSVGQSEERVRKGDIEAMLLTNKELIDSLEKKIVEEGFSTITQPLDNAAGEIQRA